MAETPNKDAARDIKILARLLKKHEENLEAAAKSARRVHGHLERCAGLYGDDLGIDIASVIPKDPD